MKSLFCSYTSIKQGNVQKCSECKEVTACIDLLIQFKGKPETCSKLWFLGVCRDYTEL